MLLLHGVPDMRVYRWGQLNFSCRRHGGVQYRVSMIVKNTYSSCVIISFIAYLHQMLSSFTQESRNIEFPKKSMEPAGSVFADDVWHKKHEYLRRVLRGSYLRTHSLRASNLLDV